MMKNHIRLISKAPAFAFALITFLLISGCEQQINIKNSEASQIYPPSLLVENLTSITLISPNNGAAYYIDDREVNNLTFEFDGKAPYYASIILFTEKPTVSQEGYVIDGKAKCLGGVSNMSSLHPWNGISSVFSTDLAESAFFVCNNESLTDAFSETEKLILDETTLKKNTAIYWAVLGYNDRYTLTHSSPLRKINIQ